MGLRELLDGIAAGRKRVTVFAAERYEALESFLEAQTGEFEYEQLPDDGSGGFVVVSEDREFVGSVGAAPIDEALASTGTAFGSDQRSTETLFELLADTAFTSLDNHQMVATAREIEDRAYRRGRGTIRTGFQSLSALRAQRNVYGGLADCEDLDVHVYGRPDWTPDLSGVTVHAEDTDEIDRFWFVVYDGGGDDQQASALLAEERDAEPDTFRGVRTYDPDAVAEINAYLREAYG
ncbi:sensor protein [Halobacteriales archaeon QS_1_67_19]|nr:MAG: sensor protein [Halobacteriales archaeon QS_1_67_19]